ncbi:anthranilate synthase component I family protein [Marinobacter daqiaonensis]|uniref:anthranilate synthase component I family protein n=1 Tax=Marinobacter daqiaonensis TaxID=650891 RepID=UPI001D125F54|nr:anthranilate synthase component I family protein [Marinobacter daqiaonensis]
MPRSQIDSLLDSLSTEPGFACLDTHRGGYRTVSALPVRQWWLPNQAERFRDTVADILEAHGNLGPETRGAGIGGSILYEAGQQTVPGFRSRHHPTEHLGWAGLYLWTLTIPATGNGHDDASLDFHQDCPRSLRDRILAKLTDSARVSREAPESFRITGRFQPTQAPRAYREGVARILDYIQAGDCYQANLSQQFTARFQGSPWLAWRSLMAAVPVPHGGYLDTGDWQLLSISPEMFLEIEQGQVTSKPIKGTRPRSLDSDSDRALALELQSDPKDRAENLMIVDLIRNDLSRFCTPFSVRVPQLFELESFRNVHQLVSTVTGQLRPGLTPFEALISAFPGGSITGAPKRRAMEIIDELEPHGRGPYCGSLFWWSADDRLDSNIAIRSLQAGPGGEIRAWAGCGIVADSDPESEYQESITKIQRLLATLENLGRQ